MFIAKKLGVELKRTICLGFLFYCFDKVAYRNTTETTQITVYVSKLHFFFGKTMNFVR
jgi:hypothetical protein